MIKKLGDMASIYQAKELRGQVYVSERIKTMNESIYYNIDIIHGAMAANRKVHFQYFNWNVDMPVSRKICLSVFIYSSIAANFSAN